MLFEGISEVIELHAPHEAAIEETFATANGSSTLKLGHARAAAMIAPARAGLVVAEYAAKVVKKAVVGTGNADKTQVAFMIARLLPTAGSPTADAAGRPGGSHHPRSTRGGPATLERGGMMGTIHLSPAPQAQRSGGGGAALVRRDGGGHPARRVGCKRPHHRKGGPPPR